SGFSINSTIQINTDIDVELQTSRNTVGAIPGNGELKDEWLILGAHIDHLGWGGEGSNSMAPDLHEIHNGADDNASGVSALLELAAYFTKEASKTESRRSILFIAFGAEEVGLLGSSYFVDNPMIPIENVVAMFNMDMVGRLTEDKLVIGGAGTSSAWEKLISDANSDSLIFTFDEQGFGSSDHQPFYLKGIPVLFFFTGAHEDYHRPTDDLEFLNIPGIMKVSNLIAGSTEYILTAFEKPDYINVQSKKQSDRGSYNVTFGVIPDFMYDGDGFRISGVRELAPAGLAGMQGGDIITSINGISILNIYDYMYALQNCTSGIEVPVVVKRGDEELILQIAPQSKSSD
ncbi:MAG: M28 family peptidase, partial [Fidelibacterota bacterium]